MSFSPVEQDILCNSSISQPSGTSISVYTSSTNSVTYHVPTILQTTENKRKLTQRIY